MTTFPISEGLQRRLRRSETRATTAVQLDGALPQPDVQTILTPDPRGYEGYGSYSDPY